MAKRLQFRPAINLRRKVRILFRSYLCLTILNYYNTTGWMCNLVNDKGIDATRFVTTFCVLSFLRVVTLFIHQFSFYFIVFSLRIIS